MATEFIEDDIEDNIEDDSEDRGDLIEDDEDQEEDDQEDQEDEEVEEESEDLPVKKEPRIPKHRFDEVIQQREDAKERNLWLEAQLEKLIGQANKVSEKEVVVETSTYDFEKAEEDYISLIIDGEIGKAAKLRAEINKEQKNDMMNIIKGIEASVSTKAKSESTALVEGEKFNNYIDSIEAKYPFLDSKHKDYNEEAVDTVNTLLAGYVASGKTQIEGLRLAVGKVSPLYSVDTTKQTLGNKRTVEAGKKAAKAAAAQPSRVKSSTSTKSVDNSDVNVEKISERDFAKLTHKERSLLRGD